MSLVTLLIVVLIVALLLYVVWMIPMDAKAKTIISVALAVIMVIWLILMVSGVGPVLRIH